MVAPAVKEVVADLSAVTVFQDRSQLTFSANVTLDVGTHVVSLKGQKSWTGMQQSTLQVRVAEDKKSAALLRNVRFVANEVKEDVRERVQHLEQAISAKQEEIEGNDDEQAVATEMIESLKAIRAKIDGLGEGADRNGNPVRLEHVEEFLQDASKWLAMGNFFARTKQRNQEKLMVLRARRTDLDKELKELQRSWNNLMRGASPEYIRCTLEESVQVTVTVNEKVDLPLLVSFVVDGASWEPLYDLRVCSNSSTMNVTYSAQVRQRTPLDWDKVHLKLSTAKPHFSASPPTLSPWSISIRPPVRALPKRPMKKGAPGRGLLRRGAPPSAPQADMAFAEVEEECMAMGGAAVEEATVRASGTASTFGIAGLATIKGDNEPVKVTIAQQEFPVSMLYTCVPKLDTQAYLVVKTTNTSEYVFLPGKTNIFSDNTFLNSSELELVPAGAEFTTSLGADESVQVSRKRIKRHESVVKTMLHSPRKHIDYQFEISVKGCQPEPADLVVYDQYPVSDNSEIAVELVPCTKTEQKQFPDGLKYTVDELNQVEWKLKLKPQKEVAFRFAFSVEYPENVSVVGIDD